MEGDKTPLQQRLGYWFDNVMAQGMLAKIKLLLVVTVVFVVLIGVLATIASGSGTPLHEGLWRTLLLTLGKGGQGEVTGNNAIYAFCMLLVVLYAMFFMATLIGLINTGIRSKVDDLGRGKRTVLESGHTLVLGYNETVISILEEFILAHANSQEQRVVVVLGEEKQSEMENAIRSKFGHTRDHPKTKIICRTGSAYSIDDLNRCSLATSRSVVVNVPTDFDTIKALMACSHILNQSEEASPSFAVAAVFDEGNIGSAKIAGCDEKGNGQDRLELLSLQEILSRIIVHTSRQPGLSEVFTELFNFAGNEIYIVDSDPSFAELAGLSVSEINLRLKNAIAIGVVRPEGGVVIADPNALVFGAGDSLIVVEKDDDPLDVLVQPVAADVVAVPNRSRSEPAQVLILGTGPIMNNVLCEYAAYLPAGSSIYLGGSTVEGALALDGSIAGRLAEANVALRECSGDIYDKHALFGILEEAQPESVAILTPHKHGAEIDEDERIIRLLLFLREYRTVRGVHFSITSEMNSEANRELASATGSDDFIIGRHFSALLMTQIAEDREMKGLFDELLSSEGFEVYMQRASNYLATGAPTDMFAVGQAVAQRGEIFIGIRQKIGGVYGVPRINPERIDAATGRAKEYVFGPDDYVVVLSESLI